MSFNFIYNPLTNEKYSIFSYEGKSLLKKYIKDYQIGGSGSRSDDGYPKDLNEFVTVEAAKVDKLNKCETKLEECKKELDEKDRKIEKGIVEWKKLYTAAAQKIGKEKQKIEKLESELQTIKAQSAKVKDVEAQSARAKDVEEKENDEGGEPTNSYKFTIEANTFKMGDFEVELNDANKLGSGGSKDVYKIEHDKNTFALAKIPKDGLNKKKFQNEINCLQNLDHPNIAKLYGVYKDDYSHYLLMEYGKSDLTSMRGQALENVELTHRFITNMVSAISYLKKMNINHRDIKLDNFIIVGEEPNQVVKLIDFGISTRCPGTDGYSTDGDPMDVEKSGEQTLFVEGGGTQFYVAPENAKGEPSVNTHPGDVFALGLCILELFYKGERKVLYGHSQLVLNMGAVKKRIKKNFPGISELEEFSKINEYVFGGQPIIQRMLSQIPTERKIEEVLEALGVSEED